MSNDFKVKNLLKTAFWGLFSREIHYKKVLKMMFLATFLPQNHDCKAGTCHTVNLINLIPIWPTSDYRMNILGAHQMP